MKYYIQTFQGMELPVQGMELPTTAVWEIHNGLAKRIDVSASSLSTHSADPGQDVLSILKRRFAESTFHELHLKPGEYFPRMSAATCGAGLACG